MNERDKAIKKVRKTNSAADWKTYWKHRSKCTATIRASKSGYSKHLLKGNTSNPKKFWNTIKSIMATKSKKHQCNTT